MQTIITAAGDSRGMFLKGGFSKPKSLLTLDGESVICRAINSYSNSSTKLMVLINQDENKEFELGSHILEHFAQAKVIEVNGYARGALVSALFALSDIDLEAPLVIAGGDSMVQGGVSELLTSLESNFFDAGTIAFPSRNPRWSYLSVGSEGEVLEVAEKTVAGPYATTGVFYFRTAGLFLEAAKWSLINNATVRGQFYVSTSLNYLISKGMRVGYQLIERDRYFSYSLPADFVRQEA